MATFGVVIVAIIFLAFILMTSVGQSKGGGDL